MTFQKIFHIQYKEKDKNLPVCNRLQKKWRKEIYFGHQQDIKGRKKGNLRNAKKYSKRNRGNI